MLIGIRQRRSHRRAPHSQVLQLSFGGGQAAAYFAQRLRSAELAKQHGHKLIPAGEAAGMPLALVLLNESFKLQSWKQPQ